MTQAELANPGVARSRDWRPIFARYATLGALIALIIFNLIVTNNFASWRTLDVNLTQVASIVIVGVGMTLVIATGGIDLSVGSLMAIAGALAPIIFLGKIVAIPEIHLAVGIAMVVSVLVAGAFGWFNGWLITRFKIQPIIATLVLFIAGRGIAQVSTNGNLQPFKLDTFQWIGLGRLFAPINTTANGFKGIPDQVFIMVIIVAIAAWAFNRSLFGRQTTGDRRQRTRRAARRRADVANVKRWVYCIQWTLRRRRQGLVHIAINSSSDANLVGMGMELDAIAAVAVGGTLLSGGRAAAVGTLVGAR